MNDTTLWKPEVISADTEEGRIRIATLQSVPDTTVVDATPRMVRELAAITHPALYVSGKLENTIATMNEAYLHRPESRVFAWYPWKKTLVGILPEEEFERIRTSRNKHLITEEEQRAFREMYIGIAGLSVGYSVALAIVLEGGGKHLRLADSDTLDLSNLNRLPYALDEIGQRKSVIVARRLYDLDPYLDLVLFSDGLDENNTPQFMSGLDVVIDEVDSLAMKQALREGAAASGIPLLMATDNEETGMIDVERYDLDPATPPFLDRIPKSTKEVLALLSKKEAGKIIATYVGEEYTTGRMRNSLAQMGESIVSWPQIGGTALINGGAIAYALRSLITDSSRLQTGRYVISLPKIFGISE